jgi:hypothetical protein
VVKARPQAAGGLPMEQDAVDLVCVLNHTEHCIYIVSKTSLVLTSFYEEMLSMLMFLFIIQIFCDCKKEKKTEPVCDYNYLACVITTMSYVWLQKT